MSGIIHKETYKMHKKRAKNKPDKTALLSHIASK